MKHAIIPSVLIITACNSVGLFGYNGFGPKKSKPEPAKINLQLRIDQLNSKALDKNCLFYAVGDEPLRKYGCNHETKPLPITRDLAPTKCVNLKLELRSYLPLDPTSCISLIQSDSDGRCEYQSEAFQVFTVGKSTRIKVANSGDQKTRTITFEDSKDNDYNDYVFTVSTNSSFCP